MKMMMHLSVECGSVARSVASPVVVEEQVVLNHALVSCYLGLIIIR